MEGKKSLAEFGSTTASFALTAMAATNSKGKQKAASASSPQRKRLTGTSGTPSSSSGSSSDSDSDSDSNASSGEDSSDWDLGSEFGDASPEYMESLLEKARENMREKAKVVLSGFDENSDEIRLSDEGPRPTELPQLDPGNLPAPYFEFKKSKREGLASARDVDSEKLEKSSLSISTPEPGKSSLPQIKKDGSVMTKKEKKAEKQKSAALGWADIPTPDATDLPRLHREVEALRLRNTLDPKRFYKKEEGEGKGIKGLPKQFAIGTILPTSTPFGTASGDNLVRAERKRTLVDELVDDSEAKRYAKRKFVNLQTARASKGRGTFAKRFGQRKTKW